MEFEESKRILLEDIRGIKEKNARIFVGMDSYTMPELANEIDNETEFGKRLVENYISVMKTIEEIKKNRQSKKKFWWKIWR